MTNPSDSSKISPGDAKRFIRKHFRTSAFRDDVGNSITPEQFMQNFNAVKHLIPFNDPTRNEELVRFLWSGCSKFNRWFVPAPYIVPRDYAKNHALFAGALQRSEKGNEQNSPVFLLHSARDVIYDQYNMRPLPLSKQQTASLRAVENSLDKIPRPSDQRKIPEFQKQTDELSRILHGLRDSTLFTTCDVYIPYPITQRPVEFSMLWRGIAVTGRITPSFARHEEFMLQAVSPMVFVPHGVASRWQFGSAKIELTLNTLVDPSIYVAPLQLPMESSPQEGWPNVFSVVFQVIYESSWRLRSHRDYVGMWIPSPSDLGDIECRLWIRNEEKHLSFVRKHNPALMMKGFVPNESLSEERAEWGEIDPTEWPDKCRIMAEQYLSLGDTREALFLLNVGVESMLDKKIRDLCERAGEGVEQEVYGVQGYWEEARALVSECDPECAERIEWPEPRQSAPSMFTKIKRLGRRCTLDVSVREIRERYSHIQRHRNALFHGENEQPIPVAEVTAALESFLWLEKNFKAASDKV